MAKIDWSKMQTPEQKEAAERDAQEALPITRAQMRRILKALGKNEAEIDMILAQEG